MPVSRPTCLRLVAGLLATCALLLHAAPAGAADRGMPDAAYDALMGTVTTVLDRTVRAYRDRDGAADPRYYDDGVWVSPSTSCWTCSLGPAVGAAVLARDRPGLLATVTASMDRAIRDHQRASGAFYGPGNSDAIQTGWFIPVLGTVYLATADRLDPATRARWAASIVAGADWLLTAKETVWYVNGNINLSYTQALWIAWKVSGATRFRDAYDASWNFTIDPPRPRWASFGLRLQTTPTRSDGADGSGYLSESGGFDPDYAQLQLDVLASFYAMSHEPRALRLMNILMNGVLPRVGPTSTLDARGGSRHSLLTPFLTPALSVLVASGSRPDLGGRLAGQIQRLASEYAGAITYTHPSFYRGVGTWLAGPLLLDAQPAGGPVLVGAPAAAPAPAPARSVPSRAPTTASARPADSSVNIASHVGVRSGAVRLTVSAPAMAVVRVSLRCGSSTCGSAAPFRSDGTASPVRVRLTRASLRALRKAGFRRVVAVVTIRSGASTKVLRRAVRLTA